MAKAPKKGPAKKNRGNQVKKLNLLRKNIEVIQKLS